MKNCIKSIVQLLKFNYFDYIVQIFKKVIELKYL